MFFKAPYPDPESELKTTQKITKAMKLKQEKERIREEEEKKRKYVEFMRNAAEARRVATEVRLYGKLLSNLFY